VLVIETDVVITVSPEGSEEAGDVPDSADDDGAVVRWLLLDEDPEVVVLVLEDELGLVELLCDV
jgi:hypothetical protein